MNGSLVRAPLLWRLASLARFWLALILFSGRRRPSRVSMIAWWVSENCCWFPGFGVVEFLSMVFGGVLWWPRSVPGYVVW